MQALIVHDELNEVQRIRAVLTRRGFLATSCGDQDEAIAHARASVIDLLVLKQVIGGRHTTSVALAAEHRHPRVATILLSARERADAVELFELVPSLHAVLGLKPDGGVLAALAVQAVQSVGAPVLVLSALNRVPTITASPRGKPQFASRRSDVA